MHFDRRVFCAFGGSVLGFWYRKSQKGKKNGGGVDIENQRGWIAAEHCGNSA